MIAVRVYEQSDAESVPSDRERERHDFAVHWYRAAALGARRHGRVRAASADCSRFAPTETPRPTGTFACCTTTMRFATQRGEPTSANVSSQTRPIAAPPTSVTSRVTHREI